MRFLGVILIAVAVPGFALTPEAKEFLEISQKLEPMQCEKRQLRRQIALAEIEKRAADVKELRSKFAKLDRDPRTSKLEHRLASLEKRIVGKKGNTRDPEDLQAISFQQREAFYRCD